MMNVQELALPKILKIIKSESESDYTKAFLEGEIYTYKGRPVAKLHFNGKGVVSIYYTDGTISRLTLMDTGNCVGEFIHKEIDENNLVDMVKVIKGNLNYLPNEGSMLNGFNVKKINIYGDSHFLVECDGGVEISRYI